MFYVMFYVKLNARYKLNWAFANPIPSAGANAWDTLQTAGLVQTALADTNGNCLLIQSTLFNIPYNQGSKK